MMHHGAAGWSWPAAAAWLASCSLMQNTVDDLYITG
jgi:hypothetical protein